MALLACDRSACCVSTFVHPMPIRAERLTATPGSTQVFLGCKAHMRHCITGPVMPVWHDLHRTFDAAFLADKAPADRRPGQVLRQGIQPDVDHAVSALTARALDVA